MSSALEGAAANPPRDARRQTLLAAAAPSSASVTPAGAAAGQPADALDCPVCLTAYDEDGFCQTCGRLQVIDRRARPARLGEARAPGRQV